MLFFNCINIKALLLNLMQVPKPCYGDHAAYNIGEYGLEKSVFFNKFHGL